MGRIQTILGKIETFFFAWGARRSVKKEMKDSRRKKILNQFVLTDEQKKKIDNFYIKNYGCKVPYEYHRYFSSYMGTFDEKYLPEYMFISEVESRFNPRDYARVFSDKNLLPLLVGKTEKYRCAKIFVSCTNGVIKDENSNLITIEDAANILRNVGKCFYKPTVDSCSGKGCCVYNFSNGIDLFSHKTIENILKESPRNFNFQEIIHNCESVHKLHPESLNTFRIVTYILDGKVFHLPVIMRIGRGTANVDNAHQGGIFVDVEDDGFLKKMGFTEFQDRFLEHPDSKIKFEGYQVPEVQQCIIAAHEMQAKLPQTKLISFDFVADEKGIPVLIEINLNYQTAWMSQMAHGKGCFGENTQRILSIIRGE